MRMDTVCRLCSACCPIEAEVESGRLIAAQRKSFLPPEKSVRCPKLQAAPEIVHSPDRLQTPLIKDRSSGSFREAGWDEALDLIAEQFARTRERFGAKAVAWLRGMAADWGAPWDYANRLMNCFGSPNSIGNGSVCHVAREMAHVFTYGAMTMPQAKASNCILVWGKNDRDTMPGAFEAISEARRNGASLIVVDPIKTPLAAKADIWLQIKPGHDGWLAMAMIHEIIRQELYDTSFVSDWTIGFEVLCQAAEPFSPEAVAEAVWLSPEDIKRAARLYATSSPACIIDGNGLDMQLQVFQATRTVGMLRALTGNLDRQGGDFIPQPVPLHNIQLKERLPQGTEPVTRGYDLFNTFHSTWGLHAQSCLVDAILDQEPYPVTTMVVQSGNPVVTMTESSRVLEAFRKLDFLAVIDPFMTQTGQLADVVLPASSCFEKTQLNRAFMRNSPVILQNQLLDWQADSWPDWKIVFELAQRLGLAEDFPWSDVEEAIDYQLEPSGLTVEQLRNNPDGLRADELKFFKYQDQGFATPSGKVELFSERLRQHGHPPVPYSDGDWTTPISFAEQSQTYDLVGISGARTNRFTHTQFHRIPSLIKREPEGFVDVHPDDAASRQIVDGDRLQVATPRGQVRMKARLSEVVPPGSVRIGWGWGELDPAQNVNNLTDDQTRDPVTCTPSSRTFMCRVEKI